MVRWASELRLVPHWQERFRDPITTPLRWFFFDGLTRTGKTLLILCLMVMLLGFRRGESYLLSSAGAGLGLLLWCKFLGWLYRPKVRLTRVAPEHGVAGKEYVSSIRLENSGPRPLMNFALREMRMPGGRWPKEWSIAYEEEVMPGGTVQMTVSATPKNRGVFSLWGVAVQSYFPFFLSRSSRKEALSRQVYVLPEPFPHALPSLRQLGETAASMNSFGANQGARERALNYSHSRPFQSGDPPMRIDQRASARRGDPMSKIYLGTEMIKPEAVAILCDTSIRDFQAWQPKPQDPQILDRRLALVVEAGLKAHGEALPVAAVCWGKEWINIANLHEFHREIATCVASREGGLPETLPNPGWIYVAVLGRWNSQIESRINQWRGNGYVVIVFLLPESDQDRGSLPTDPGFYEVGQ